MDLTSLQTIWASTQTPWLPEAAVARWALHGAWGLVLGALVWRVGRVFWHRWCGLVALVVCAWALWPGPESPAYWLGLAFQAPSLMSVVLCVVWALQQRRASPFADYRVAHQGQGGAVLAGAGVLLGWVLLLDMLAWWPVSVYALGFGTQALVLVCGLALVLWFASGAARANRSALWCLVAVLVVFALTRLPSGNLWDALLDPWLWIVLQARGLAAWVRGRSSARSWSRATRA